MRSRMEYSGAIYPSEVHAVRPSPHVRIPVSAHECYDALVAVHAALRFRGKKRDDAGFDVGECTHGVLLDFPSGEVGLGIVIGRDTELRFQRATPATWTTAWHTNPIAVNISLHGCGGYPAQVMDAVQFVAQESLAVPRGNERHLIEDTDLRQVAKDSQLTADWSSGESYEPEDLPGRSDA